MSSDNEGIAAVLSPGETVQSLPVEVSGRTQDVDDKSRSVIQILVQDEEERERDSNGEEQEQQQDSHDSHAGEEEDGGVKVHDEDDGGGDGDGEGEGQEDEDQNGSLGGVSKKGCDGRCCCSQPQPPQGTEESEEEEEEDDDGDGDGEGSEVEEDDDDQSDNEDEEEEDEEEDVQEEVQVQKEQLKEAIDVVQGQRENLQPEYAEDDTEQPIPEEQVIITPDAAVIGIEPNQDTVENCTEAVKEPSNSPPSLSISPPPQAIVEVEAPAPNNIPEPTELLPEDHDPSPPEEEEQEDKDNITDDNTGRDEAPDLASETTGEENNNPNPADTSAEGSASASAAPVFAPDSIDPILESQEQNVNSREEQSDQDSQGEQVLVADCDQENLSTDFAKPLDSTDNQPPRKENNNSNHIIITVIYDINEPLPLPPVGYQTAIVHPNPPVAEQIEHVGIKVVEEEEVTPAADTPAEDEPEHFPVIEPQKEEANPNDSLKTDNGELPGEVEPLPAAEEVSSVEAPPPAYTPIEPEKEVSQDPIVVAIPIMSEVSALSNGTGSYKDATPPTLQQPFEGNPFGTSFAAGPLDDEAAAATNAHALAMSAVGVQDGSRRPRKDKSHKKKDRSSGDGAEKERKHKDRGDKGDRERAKSRERGEKGKRDRSELGIGERRAKSRDRLRDDGKSRDRDRDPREKEKKHRTPEEKAEREARKAAKKGLISQTPVYADIAVPYEQYDQQYDPQAEEERRRRKAAKRSGIVAGELLEPLIEGGMDFPYEGDRKEKKKSKKSRPPPIDTESTQQQYEQQEDQLKRRKSSKKAAAILGEPAIMDGAPMSPYIDGPIEQPKRRKSSKRSPPPDIGIEPVHVLYEPDARPPPANRRSRSDSLKNPIPGLINEGSGSGEKKHKKKDSAHLSPEEREKRRRKHEDDKALREGRKLADYVYNGSKEKRKADRAAQKAAKARGEAEEGIPPPILSPRYTDDLTLPIQIPDNQPEISPSVYGGDQYVQPHRDEQDLNAPNPEAPFSPRSFAASDDLAKAEKAARRAERKARKEARQAEGGDPDHPKDSGHSLSSEGKREREHHHHKSRDKTDRTRSRSRPAGPEDEEERRRRKEERREAKRLAALNGTDVRDGKEKKSKHREGSKEGVREGGRARSNSERNREKDMMREMEVGYQEGYGNASQQSWQAGGEYLTDREDGKVGLMRRTFSKFLKF